MTVNRQIVLRAYPQGELRESDFALHEADVGKPAAGQFLLQNQYLSMDAGFRQWMNAGSGDNYLQAMALGAPVQSIVLGRVVESKHPDFPVGAIVSARTAWEEYSLTDGSDLCSVLEVDSRVPLQDYMAALGPTGMTAYFGFLDVGAPQPGEVLVVSAAAGAVGTVVGQLGKIRGCRAIGLTSTEAKAAWLRDEFGFDAAISRERDPDLAAALQAAAPEGIDIFFDNVGGKVLDTVLPLLRENARVVLCGAIAQYETSEPQPIYNSWHLITKRATARGFMFSDYEDRFPAATRQLAQWLLEGRLKSACQVYKGIESAPRAFCDMLQGRSRGKCLVELGAPSS